MDYKGVKTKWLNKMYTFELSTIEYEAVIEKTDFVTICTSELVK